ncbi:uncharacterized protein LOC136001001 isoform X2 [Caloenas nicobarica]
MLGTAGDTGTRVTPGDTLAQVTMLGTAGDTGTRVTPGDTLAQVTMLGTAGDTGTRVTPGDTLAQMFVYLSFPVGVFWVSNQAAPFQGGVVKRKREIFPPDNPERRRALAELKRRLREGTRD